VTEIGLHLGGYGFCLLKSRAVLSEPGGMEGAQQTVGLQHHDSELTYRASQQIWRPCLSWVVCHERSRSKRRRATVREMKEGPSGSAIRC